MSDLQFAYEKSVEVLNQLSSPFGFLASVQHKDNYHRVFSRDGVIIGLAALVHQDTHLIKTFKKTLLTLKQYQGRNGEIPSNVDADSKQVSYGGTTGRVDATLWYVIGVVQYVKRTKDEQFLKNMMPSLKKCISLLESWEFNLKGFIYVPQGGDWADEYINEGYVLYDEVLYYQALKEYAYALKTLKQPFKDPQAKAQRLKEMIKVNFYPQEHNKNSKYVYLKEFFEVVLKRKETRFMCSSFFPGARRNNFDSFGNALAVLCGVTDEVMSNTLFEYILEKFSTKTKYMIPAFYPAITHKDEDWNALRSLFRFSFKNRPYRFHNGGLWPLTTGITACAFAHEKQYTHAQTYLKSVADALEKKNWGFYEYIDAQTHQPKGTGMLGFSASAYILAYQSIMHNKKVFL